MTNHVQMPTRSLALVIHFHQPVGNLDAVVERATDRCYRPFLESLADYPAVPITLHYSGCLLEWIEANAPDVAERLEELVGRGQVELMTGGFYEPVLAALPEQDRVGQIKMLSDHLRERYHAEPSGIWLTERVWEQDVVASLVDAGATYTVVDDTIFHSVGIPDDRLTGPFITDHDGRPLLVYAGDRELRYGIPYRRIESVLEHLDSGAPRLFVYADDGEKFGEWPDTHERVYGDKWLARFFEELLALEHVALTRLGDHASTGEAVGRVYLPSSSYDEMMRWALPNEARLTLGRARRKLEKQDPDGILPFLKGAPWRSFLAKYPEANRLHKRMLDVSRRLRISDDEEARRELYRAQCNCAYWHGAFGGVYLGFMRTALWHHLMRAEAIAQTSGPPNVTEMVDVDADGRAEVVLRAPWGCVVAAPHLGGMLVELDDWKVGANLLAVVARRQEAYHLEDENPVAEIEAGEMRASQARAEIGDAALEFDELERGALIDMIDGRRVTGPYEVEIEGAALIKLRRDEDELRIEKQLSADAEELITLYNLTHLGKRRRLLTFATVASVLPLSLGREVEADLVEFTPLSWSIRQPFGELGLEVSFSEPAKVTATAIETASASLEGLRILSQGTELKTTWEIELAPGGCFDVELRWRTLPGEGGKAELGVSA